MLRIMLEDAIKAGATSVDYKADEATPTLWFRVDHRNIPRTDVPSSAVILERLGLHQPAGHQEDGFVRFSDTGDLIEYCATPVRGSDGQSVWHIVFHMPGHPPEAVAPSYRAEVVL